MNHQQKHSPYLIIDPVDAVYDETFECPLNLPYKLDVFQQQAAKGIFLEHNVLLSCHTGAGKTIPCLIAINHYLKQNKRVIYTSPVKSLSNQKYKEFSEKIPDVGIMTGDIKCNPDAQCVIMTTEILRNMLYKQTSDNSTASAAFSAVSVGEAEEVAAVSSAFLAGETVELAAGSTIGTIEKTNHAFSKGFLDTVGCVIFDEIHYINDKDRGKNWEESIVMLPSRIKILGCSGTIDQPEKFASWIGDIKKIPIHLIRTVRRPIPLNHYVYVDNMDSYNYYKKTLTATESKKKTAEVDLKLLAREASRSSDPESVTSTSEKKEEFEKKGMIHIMKGDIFLARNYDLAHSIYQNKCVDPISKKPTKKGNPRYSKSQAPGDLNTFLDFLKKGRYLPSLIFVLSRRRVEEYAAAVQITLLDHEESNQVARIFDSNLSKFGRFYKELNQYNQVRDLLIRGIGIHHSGLIPVLKEAVEILFSKGLIKLLFATETFAIGVNMPTKTVVFTEFYKPTGASTGGSGEQTGNQTGNKSNSGSSLTRILKTDEYLQMSGRAGRRGLDSTGTIIIFPVRELPNHGEMTLMMTGHTPSITSKFSPGYQFILKCLVNDKDLWRILGSSLRARQDKSMEESQNREREKKAIEYEERKQKMIKTYGDNILEYAEDYNKLYQKTLPQAIGNMTLKPSKDKNLEKNLAELGRQVSKACYKEYLSLMELQRELPIKTLKSKASSASALASASAGNADADTDVDTDAEHEKLEPIFEFLKYLGYLEKVSLGSDQGLGEGAESKQNKLRPTVKGIIASEINDSNCLLLTEMIMQGFFDILDGPEMLALLALFIEESDRTEDELSPEDKKRDLPPNLRLMIDRVFYMRDDLEALEEEQVLSENVFPDTDWSVHLDFVPIAFSWASGCHVSEIYKISNIYEGNLIKSMLRLQNMAEGITEVFKTLEKHEQANKLREVSSSIIRDIVTNNSLYVTT